METDARHFNESIQSEIGPVVGPNLCAALLPSRRGGVIELQRRASTKARRWWPGTTDAIGRFAFAMPVVEVIRDARPDEASALEALQRRSSDVWEEHRALLAANPDAIEPPHRAIAERRVRVAVDATGRRLGFSVVRPPEGGRCELDDLFVEPDSMRLGVGRMLVDDVVARARAEGASSVDVIANPNVLGF